MNNERLSFKTASSLLALCRVASRRHYLRAVVLMFPLLVLSAPAQAQNSTTGNTQTSNTPAPTADQEPKPERGVVEFGVRSIWGDVYGRPDLPFKPSIFTSKY